MVVTCSLAIIAPPGRNVIPVISVDMVNSGVRPVTITQAGLCFSNGLLWVQPTSFLFGKWPLPAKLDESDSVSVLLEQSQVHQRFVDSRLAGEPFTVTTAFAKDSTGKAYLSEPLDWLTEAAIEPK